MKKLVFCFILLNAVNVCAHLHPHSNQGREGMKVNEYSLKDKVIQKWNQITDDILLQVKNSEKIRKQAEFDCQQNNTKILVEAFLRECN